MFVIFHCLCLRLVMTLGSGVCHISLFMFEVGDDVRLRCLSYSIVYV